MQGYRDIYHICRTIFFINISEESLKLLQLKLFLIYFPPLSINKFFHIIAIKITIHESQ